MSPISRQGWLFKLNFQFTKFSNSQNIGKCKVGWFCSDRHIWLLYLINYFFPTDIDECEQGLDGCDHNCTNTVGSYICTCMDGYELESDNHNCTGMQIINFNFQ